MSSATLTDTAEQHGAAVPEGACRPRTVAAALPAERASWHVRHVARITLVLCGAGAVYGVYRGALGIVHAWQDDWPLQQSWQMLLHGGVKLAAYAGATFAMALLTGWLWRAGWFRLRSGARLPLVAGLTAAGWACLVGKLGRKWSALAHDEITCDAVLIGLLLGFLFLGLLGFAVGAGRERLTRLRDRWWLAGVLVAWLIIAGFANQLTAVVSVAATLAVAFVIGQYLLKKIGPHGALDPLEEILFSEGLGLGALGLAVLAVGELRLLYWWWIAPACAVVLYLGYRRFAASWKAICAAGEKMGTGSEPSGVFLGIQRPGEVPVPIFSRLAGHWGWASLALILTVLVTACLIGNLGPEVQGDALTGRLGPPAMYAREHAVKPKPHIFYTYSTCGSEMLCTPAILLGGQTSAGKLMHFAMGVLSLAAVFALGRRWQDWRVGLLAAFAVGSSSIVWWLLASAYTDLTFLGYGVLAAWALYRWFEDRQGGWLAVSGLLAGFAAGVKLTGGFLIVPAVVLVWCASAAAARSLRNPAPYRNAAIYGLCSVVGVLPWLSRTWWYTGNPVWPWLMLAFEPSLPAFMKLGYHFSPGPHWSDWLHIPSRMVFSPRRYIEQGGHSPVLLALLPGCVGVGLARGAQLWFAAYTAGITALWIGSDVNLRYGLVQVALLSVIGGGMLLRSCQGCRGPLQHASYALLSLAAVGGVGFVLFHDPLMKLQNGPIFPYKVMLQTSSPEAHAHRLLPLRRLVEYLNRTYGANARVWSPVHMETLNQLSESLAWSWHGRELQMAHLMDPAAPSEQLHAGVRQLGITHLVCSERMLRDPGGNPWAQGVFGAAFTEDPRYCELELAIKGYYLFRVLPEGAPPQRKPQGPNLLANGCFDAADPLHGWQQCGRPQATAPSTSVDGTTAVRVDLENYVHQTVHVREGSLYRLAAEVKPESEQSEVLLALWWLDGNGVPLYVPYFEPLRLAAGFQELVRCETAPPGARQLTLKIHGATAAGKVWATNVRLNRWE